MQICLKCLNGVDVSQEVEEGWWFPGCYSLHAKAFLGKTLNHKLLSSVWMLNRKHSKKRAELKYKDMEKEWEQTPKTSKIQNLGSTTQRPDRHDSWKWNKEYVWWKLVTWNLILHILDSGLSPSAVETGLVFYVLLFIYVLHF